MTEEAVKRYVDKQADLYFNLDVTGLNQTASAGTSGSVAELLGVMAPVANFRPLTKAYVAGTSSTADSIATTTVSVSISIGSNLLSKRNQEASGSSDEGFVEFNKLSMIRTPRLQIF